jgi:Putative lumazine-binding
MIDHSSIESLTAAVQRYFDLMYDGDTSRFDRVFRTTAQLHGLRDGKMAMFTAQGYKELTASRPSPKSLKAPREEEILMMDFASPTQALVKVRVRINKTVYVDHLTYHLVDGEWLISSKGYHVERTD